MASSTSQFVAASAWDGIEDDNEPLVSGRPFLSCGHFGKAIFAISLTKLAVQVSTCETVPVVFVLLLKKICLIFVITENHEKFLTAKIS